MIRLPLRVNSPHALSMSRAAKCTYFRISFGAMACTPSPARLRFWILRNLPMQRRVLTIVGGGVIGVEYACIAAALGVSVTLIERRNRILEFLDDQIVEALSYHMRSQGVTFCLGEELDDVSKTADARGRIAVNGNFQARQMLGVHIVGEGATELIHIGQSVLGFEGTIDFLVNIVFNYPTLAECYKVDALNGLNRLNLGSMAARPPQSLSSEAMSAAT